MSLYNSYGLTWPLIVLLGAFRLVCTNGLVVGEKFFQLKKRHILELERMDFREQVKTALERFNNQVETWKKWGTRLLSLATYEKVMKSMELGKRATETIEEEVSEDFEGFLSDGYPQPSVWTFYNLITSYITHQAVSLNHRLELENRLRKAMVHLGN